MPLLLYIITCFFLVRFLLHTIIYRGVLDPCVTATNRVPWRFTGKESEVAPGFRDLTVTLLKTSLTDNDLAVQLEGIASSARVAETSIGFSPTTLKSAT